ncbi:MAG: transcription-repair coupling factor [Thermodesulfobacteriota bacterium]
MVVYFTDMDRLFSKAIESISSLEKGEKISIFSPPPLRTFVIAALFNKTPRSLMVIVQTREDGERFARDLGFYNCKDSAILFPPWEVLPFEEQSPHPEIVAERMEVLYRLSTADPTIVIATPRSIMQRVIPREVFNGSMEIIEPDKNIDMYSFVQRMQNIGYSRMALVEERGEMSVRGGIVDIFPPMYPNPIRLEFLGDRIDDMRFFDIATQRSGRKLGRVVILPSRELTIEEGTKQFALRRLKERADELEMPRDAREPLTEKVGGALTFAGMECLMPLFYPKLDTIFDYMPVDTICLIDREGDIKEEADAFQCEIDEMMGRAAEKHQFFVKMEDAYLTSEYMKGILEERGGVFFDVEDIPSNGLGTSFHKKIELPCRSNLDIRQDISLRKEEILRPLADRIVKWLDMGWQVLLAVSTNGQAERLKELLDSYNITVQEAEAVTLPFVGKVGQLSEDTLSSNSDLGSPISASQTSIVVGDLSSGFRFTELGLVVVTEGEIFGERIKRRPPPSKKLDAFLMQLQDLDVGDYVVHTDHGIGVYRGLTRLKIEDVDNDFLILEYQNRDKLYLPAQRLNLVSKYHGIEGRLPSIDRLGGTRWVKTKGKIKEAVEVMARELLELYAARKVVKGFAFSKPDMFFSEFEATFEYDETPDQRNAIIDVLNDMQEVHPMDRLVCGDVGYGKTEVAIRAAFKAVFDGKQVAVLVPTTILAQQHFNTFKERLAPYPVNIDILSRFKRISEQKETLKRLKSNDIDIVIGTHRLLQRDISFKDLGLVVIDEEHRFGVRHKEKLKQLRRDVDVLTLTATPIPRTLHMALSNIRGLSIINTPPEDRLAIKTVITGFDDSVIRDSIMRELSRGGQVFFVHNRVKGIESIADMLKRVVPEARIAIAHGQMKPRVLEEVMAEFINKKYDVLLSTSIIESGLDIPSANTIIINRADMFGLAEVYQLRGRVGRSKHRAYAYLLVPPVMSLTADARKRLEVLRELSELGAGFRIAAYDLEIRGAGELLGSAQSGQMAEVGFDMYTQLLDEAIRESKGEKVEKKLDPEINLHVSAYIPEEYMPDARQRLNIYKRMATLTGEAKAGDLKVELRDRFGKLPELVENLFKIITLKLMLREIGGIELLQKKRCLYIRFAKNTKMDINVILNIVKRDPKRYRLTPDSRLIYMYDSNDSIEAARNILKMLIK